MTEMELSVTLIYAGTPLANILDVAGVLDTHLAVI